MIQLDHRPTKSEISNQQGCYLSLTLLRRRQPRELSLSRHASDNIPHPEDRMKREKGNKHHERTILSPSCNRPSSSPPDSHYKSQLSLFSAEVRTSGPSHGTSEKPVCSPPNVSPNGLFCLIAEFFSLIEGRMYKYWSEVSVSSSNKNV